MENSKLNFEIFAGQLRTPFRVKLEGGHVVELQLVEANDNSTHGNEVFSLIFQGPSKSFLQQSIYQVEHDIIGEFDLFLVPIDQDENGYRYEAVFNRMN